MISNDGFIKILHFGLAKLAPAGKLPSGLPTSAAWETQPGLILGTIQYMSPEQVRGAPSDIRSDRFSIGLMLYEMLTGSRPFERDTAAEMLVAILREPFRPIVGCGAEVPAPLGWAIERCLAKDPVHR